MGKFSLSDEVVEEPTSKKETKKRVDARAFAPEENGTPPLGLATEIAQIHEKLRIIIVLLREISEGKPQTVSDRILAADAAAPRGKGNGAPWTEVPGAEALLKAAEKYLKAHGKEALANALDKFGAKKISGLDDGQKAAFLESIEE